MRQVKMIGALAVLIMLASCTQSQISSTPNEIPATPTQTSIPATSTPIGTATATQPSIGDTKVSEIDGMVQVYVPAGSFLMGTSDEATEWQPNEFPQHEVYLDAFWIDQTEVTNAMFAMFLNSLGNQSEGNLPWLDVGFAEVHVHEQGGVWIPDSGYEQHPVLGVSWHGANAYCEWAGRRLPTEAEWEKAARGSDGAIYPWGNAAPTCDLVNYKECYGGPTEAGSHPDGASPYGAFNMTGNVSEWVADWWDRDYYSNSPSSDPQGPPEGEHRILRGGFWDYYPGFTRAAVRMVSLTWKAESFSGIRCAISE
jgi:formylglycine-generating enzyme required for sulfatase activity